MDRVRLEPGDYVYVLQSDVDSASLVVVPVERVTEWIQLGRKGERKGIGQQTEGMEHSG